MTKYILDGDFALRHIPVGENKLRSMKLLGITYLSSVLPVEGGSILAQLLDKVSRLIIRTRRRNIIFWSRNTGGTTFRESTGRFDKTILLSDAAQKTLLSIPPIGQRYVVTANLEFYKSLNYSVSMLQRNEAASEEPDSYYDSNYVPSVKVNDVIICYTDPEKSVRYELFQLKLQCSALSSIPNIQIRTIGKFDINTSALAVSFIEMVNGRSTQFIYYLTDNGIPSESVMTPTWPAIGYEDWLVFALSSVGRGKVAFYSWLRSTTEYIHVLVENPELIILDVFNLSYVSVPLTDIDPMFSGVKTNFRNNLCYVGNNFLIVFVNHQGVEHRLFKYDLSNNIWMSLSGPWNNYANYHYNGSGICSYAPGHFMFSSLRVFDAQTVVWVTWDYGATWNEYLDDGESFWNYEPVAYGADNMPTRFMKTLVKPGEPTKIYGKLVSDIYANIIVDEHVLMEGVDYTGAESYEYPLLCYLGDEDDRAPLLSGHKGVLEGGL